jgi:hypothetical protein
LKIKLLLTSENTEDAVSRYVPCQTPFEKTQAFARDCDTPAGRVVKGVTVFGGSVGVRIVTNRGSDADKDISHEFGKKSYNTTPAVLLKNPELGCTKLAGTPADAIMFVIPTPFPNR